MSPPLPSLRGAWRAWRNEGLRAVVDRVAGLLAEVRRARSFAAAPPGWRPPEPIPVLRLAATPPAARLGGTQAQLLARLTAEESQGPVALLYPGGDAWRLEVAAHGHRRALVFPGRPRASTALEDAGFESAVRAAARAIQARAVHVEGLAGFPLASLGRLRRDLRLIVSLHDFAAFCLRPHLVEQPRGRFCDYSRDLERCRRCLRATWPLPDGFQADRRAIAADLLGEAEVVVFPSRFLRRVHRDLFPDLPTDEKRWRVLAPAIQAGAACPPRPAGRPLRHVAYVGSVQEHKGARVFADVARRLHASGLRFSVYGGGDPDLLALLAALPGVHVCGTYRQGTLGERLRSDDVDLALLLSVLPESHSFTLDECVRAGVPILGFRLGALAERVPDLGAGALVPLDGGAEGVAATLAAMQAGPGAPRVDPGAAARIPDPATTAAGMRALYGELGLI